MIDSLYDSAPADVSAWLAALNLSQTIDGEDVAPARFFDVPYAVTERVIASAPAADAATVDLAVASALSAYRPWSRTPWAQRQAALLHFADLLERETPTLSTILSAESGRPLRRAYFEMVSAVRYVRTVAGVPAAEESIAHDRASIRLIHRPLGVVAAIAPWNGPVILAVVKIATALVAGNTMVLKPSPFTPLSALYFGQLARQAFPNGVVNVINGDGSVGAALVGHADVAKVSFTGSTATGKTIAAVAASTLKRVTLELGGNDAAIVLDDADLDKLVETATQTGIANCGAFCGGVKRVYVHRSIHDELVERFHTRLERVVMGDAFDRTVDMGPVQNRPQYERVARFRRDAAASGGQLHSSSQQVPPEGLFLAPTVVSGLDNQHRLVVEEQFGPLLPILAFDDVAEAIELSNAGPYGLGGSVWTRDLTRGAALAADLEVGTAWVNQHGAFDAAVPMPLAKDSGLGIDYGDYGVAEHGQAMVINVVPA